MDPQQSPQQPSNQPSQPWEHPEPQQQAEPQPAQPVVQPAQSPYMAQPATTAQTQQPGGFTSAVPQITAPQGKHRNLKIVLTVVATVAVLAIGGVVYALMSDKGTGNRYADSPDNNSGSAAPSVNTASRVDDYKVVCQGSKISNGAEYDENQPGPHTIAMFEKGSGGGTTDAYVTSVVYLGDGADAKYDQPQDVQLVGCLSRSGKGEFVKNCELKDSDDKIVSLKLMRADYNLDIYAAKTGKKITHTTISQTNTSCPFVAYISSDEPTYYALPDSQAVKVAVQTYTN